MEVRGFPPLLPTTSELSRRRRVLFLAFNPLNLAIYVEILCAFI